MASVHEGIKPFHCIICDAGFVGKGTLKNMSHQFMKEKRLSNVCNNSFAQIGQLKTHVVSVHEGNESFKCNICDASFTEKGKLKKHMSSVHEGKKPFKCYICDTSFARNDDLKKHVTVGI